MKVILIAPMPNSDAVLPPMDSMDGELHLTYLVDGVRTGGFSLVGNAPQYNPATHTCFVRIHSSPETIQEMVDSGDYLFVEEIAEAAPEVVVTPMSPRIASIIDRARADPAICEAMDGLNAAFRDDTDDAYGDIVSFAKPEPEIVALAKSDETDAILYEALAHWADNQTGWMCQLREHYCDCDSFYNYEDEPEPHEEACAFRDAVDWVEAMFAGSRSEIVALADPKPEPKPKHELPGRAAVVQWLRDHGYSPALLNAKIPPGAPAHGVRRGLQDLHEVSEEEYGRAWH